MTKLPAPLPACWLAFVLVAFVAAIPVFSAPSNPSQVVPRPAPPHCCQSVEMAQQGRPSSPAPRADNRGFDVLEYDLNIRLDPSRRSITGAVDIRLVFLTALEQTLELDLVTDLDCTGVILNAEILDHEQQGESLLITLPLVPTPGDTISLTVTWEGQPPRHGNYYAGLLFRTLDQGTSDTSDDVPIIASISEPWTAHSWWPCKDHLADKALFKAAITVPDTLEAISNGTLVGTTMADAGWKTFRWVEEFPMPTYLFSVAVSDFRFWQESCAVDSAWPGFENIPLEFYVFPEDEAAAIIDMEPSCRMMQMLTDLAGPYPFQGEKYAQVEIKWIGAMEHSTAVSISQYLITGDHEYENVIVHEMAHHWFGDSLTPTLWADIWLNEGFARYCEALWVEHAYGRQAYVDYMAMIGPQVHPELFLGMGTLADPDPILPNILVYDKGAWVLQMLRTLIGDNDFFTFFRDYAQSPALAMGSVSTADLIFAAELASGQNLASFFESWLTTDLAPSLQIRTDINKADGGAGPGPYVRVEITQTQDPLFTMAVPIRLHTACGIVDEKIIIENQLTVWRWTASCTIDSVSIDPEGLALFQLGPPPVAALKVEGPIPNPASGGGADFFFTLLEPGSLVVNLYDVRGYRLATFDGGLYSANGDPEDQTHLWHWNGTAAGDKPTAAGIYWLEFLVGQSRQVQKVVLLP